VGPPVATKTGDSYFDFEARIDGVAFAAPHVAEVGRVISIVPASASTTYGEIHWGDGTFTTLPSGWRANSPANLNSHVYTTPGRYRIEYFAIQDDGNNNSSSLIVGVVGAGAIVPPEFVASGCNGGPAKRVLFVGNSQIGFNNLPLVVSSLSESAPANCPRIVTGSIAEGDANLRGLWNSGVITAALQSGAYDTVVLAESLDLIYPQDPGYPNDFYTYGALIINQAKSLGVRPILYATPSVKLDRPASDYAAMATYNGVLASTTGTTLAATGLAWLRAWEQVPTLNLHDVDGAHPGYVGAVLSGYVLYAAITGASPVGLTANPSAECDGPCPVITGPLASVLQPLAWQQYQTYANYVRTPTLSKSRAPVIRKSR
jgi:hypothetical protein